MRAVVLVDHGSRVPAANEVVVRVAAALAGRMGSGVLVVHAHQENAAPDLAAALAGVLAAGATDVTVVPFFLAPGRHASEDIPRIARTALAGRSDVTLRVGRPLGDDVSGLADVVAGLLPR